MADPVTKMGYEAEIYYGVKGSAAATKLTNSRDITLTNDVEKGETTVRGTGATPPIKYERVTKRSVSVEWTMTMKSDDTSLTALLTAQAAGTPVAILTKNYTGSTSFDGDVTLNCKRNAPLNGEQSVTFTGTPTDDDRAATIA